MSKRAARRGVGSIRLSFTTDLVRTRSITPPLWHESGRRGDRVLRRSGLRAWHRVARGRFVCPARVPRVGIAARAAGSWATKLEEEGPRLRGERLERPFAHLRHASADRRRHAARSPKSPRCVTRHPSRAVVRALATCDASLATQRPLFSARASLDRAISLRPHGCVENGFHHGLLEPTIARRLTPATTAVKRVLSHPCTMRRLAMTASYGSVRLVPERVEKVLDRFSGRPSASSKPCEG